MTTLTLCFIDTETTGLDPERHEIWEVACILRQPIEEHLRDRPPAESRRLEGAKWVDTEFVWQLPVDLARADTIALNIGRLMERRWKTNLLNQDDAIWGHWDPSSTQRIALLPHQMPAWAWNFASLTWGAHLIGCVPSFDENRLERLLRRHGACPGWHYQPIDVETMAAGYLMGYARGIARVAPSGVQAREIREKAGIDLPNIGQFSGAVHGSDIGKQLPWDSETISMALGVDPAQFDRHTALGDARWACAIWDRIHRIGDPA